MPSRAQIELPHQVTTPQEHISYSEGLDRSLAEQYGTVVTGIGSQEELHTLFARQARYLLDNIVPDMSEREERAALRVMSRPHKHEEPFWRDDCENTASARVLFPYAAPVYRTVEEVEDIDQPLRMSLGLLRMADRIRTVRATLWVSEDYQKAQPGSYRVEKCVTAYTEHDDPESAEAYLRYPMRSAARSTLPLAKLLERLE